LVSFWEVTLVEGAKLLTEGSKEFEEDGDTVWDVVFGYRTSWNSLFIMAT
jgi:hypothetical protein